MATSISSVLAHAGQPIAPHDLWSSWGTDPVVYSALLVVAWCYVLGLRRLWATAGRGRGVARWRAASFLLGLFVCWMALESPIDALGSALFSGHMLQHELLTVVAAPLLVLGEPLVAVARALPPPWRRRLGTAERYFTGAGAHAAPGWWLAGWFFVFVASFWVWHIPPLYDAALRNDALHSIQHATFLLGALGLWWCVAGRRRLRIAPGGVLVLFGVVLQGAWGGTIFSFATAPLYQPYEATTAAWGLTPVEDLNAGGVIMWTAGGAVFIFAGVALLYQWLGHLDRNPKPLPDSVVVTSAAGR